MRIALDRLDAAIDDALVQAAPVRVASQRIRARLDADANIPGLSDPLLDEIAKCLQRLLANDA